MVRFGVPATLVAMMLLSGCGSNEAENDSVRDYVSISDAWVSPDGLKLHVMVEVCDEGATVEITDQGDKVELRASTPRTDAAVHRACLTAVIVQLKSDLGERTVVDATSGNEVPVELAPSSYDWSS